MIRGAAIEGLSRSLAGEIGPHGVGVLRLRSDAIPESWPPGADRAPSEPVLGIWGTECDSVATALARRTLLGRLPTLAEVANTAFFVASDRSSAMTGTTVNLSCRSLVD